MGPAAFAAVRHWPFVLTSSMHGSLADLGQMAFKASMNLDSSIWLGAAVGEVKGAGALVAPLQVITTLAVVRRGMERRMSAAVYIGAFILRFLNSEMEISGHGCW